MSVANVGTEHGASTGHRRLDIPASTMSNSITLAPLRWFSTLACAFKCRGHQAHPGIYPIHTRGTPIEDLG